jgi:hypothetical protein
MRRTTRIIYLLHEGRHFLNYEKMISFINEIVAQNFFVDFGNGFPELKIMPQNPTDPSWQPGYSQAMETCVTAFIERRLETLRMVAYSVEREAPLGGFDFWISFKPTRSDIRITLNHIAFMHQEETRQIALANWLKLFTTMYEIWHPVYGYCYPVDIDWPKITEPEDIADYRIPCLYEINFLGPEIVEQLGRERILSTPAWKVQPLSDGGVLIVPEFYFTQRRFGKHDPDIWERATRHLDLPVRVPGKEIF